MYLEQKKQKNKQHQNREPLIINIFLIRFKRELFFPKTSSNGDVLDAVAGGRGAVGGRWCGGVGSSTQSRGMLALN